MAQGKPGKADLENNPQAQKSKLEKFAVKQIEKNKPKNEEFEIDVDDKQLV